MTTTVRIPTGSMTYEESPAAKTERSIPDHGYVEVRVELSPEETAAIERERETLSAGYAAIEPAAVIGPVTIVDRPRRRAFNPALLGALAFLSLGVEGYPDLASEEPERDEPNPERARAEPMSATPLEAAVVEHWDPFAHHVYRREQRANRKQRAARKRKRGWA